MELDEVSQLLDVSKEQYDEILSIVQRHTDETVNWLSDMAAEFGWVGRAGSNSSGPENIFSITMVRRTDGDNWTKAGLLLAHRPEVVHPKISRAAGLKKGGCLRMLTHKLTRAKIYLKAQCVTQTGIYWHKTEFKFHMYVFF